MAGNVMNSIQSEFVQNNIEVEPAEENNMQDFDDIAVVLLRENLLLTALELHTELTESGQELPRLRDYFSNPGNFEKQAHMKPEMSSGLARTSSVQTFDSLDFARYSDDGEKQVDERVAVLEFELRKAKDTIKSLRANLTTAAADSETNTPDTNADQVFIDDMIKPHEQRALNFLVNEYLLKYKYRLTSITFADENEEQDFEDWDDVGLNIPKPADLVSLYREFMHHIYPRFNTQSIGIQTHFKDNKLYEFQVLQNKLETEIVSLKERLQTVIMEREMQDLYIKQERNNEITQVPLKILIPKDSSWPETDECSTNELEASRDILPHIPSNLNHSEEIELITDEFTRINADGVKSLKMCEENSKRDSFLEPVRRVVSEEFHRTVLEMCYTKKCLPDNRLATEVERITENDVKIVEMLGRCLPHIVPNVILTKREELIPILLCTIKFHPNAEERDNLLNILFNLIKRPNVEQRQMILNGFANIAMQIGPTRIESELLPQCWEQVAHKYVERRLLVAESCGVLAPYVPVQIRSSLLLSMLQEMLEDKSELVREAVVKSLTVVFAFIDNEDKFSQGCELLTSLLLDESERIVSCITNMFLPVLASWALELNKLEIGLIKTLIGQLENHIKNFNFDGSSSSNGIEERILVAYGNAISSLMPWLFLSVLQSSPFLKSISRCSQDGPTENRTTLIANSPLEDLNVITGDNLYVLNLFSAYENYTSEEWFESWEKYDWLAESLISQLLSICHNIPVAFLHAVMAFAKLFHRLCVTFRSGFVSFKLKPQFSALLLSISEGINHAVLTTSLVPIYGIGVLAVFFKEEDQKEFVLFVKDLLITLCLHHLSLDGLRLLIAELCCDPVLHELLVSVLWNGVVHSSSKVRCGTARLFELLIINGNDIVLGTKITPALVTLASDSEITVRIATIPAFGAIIKITSQKELSDKVRLQFQTFLDDPQYEEDNNILVELIRTFGQISTSVNSAFREEFIIPCLSRISGKNVHEANEMKKLNIAVALLEAYYSLSCCIIGEHLILDSVLPGLRSLKLVIDQISPANIEDIAVMIREFETKVESLKPTQRSSNFVSNLYMSPANMEEVKNKVSKIFTGAKSQGKGNISNIFPHLKRK